MLYVVVLLPFFFNFPCVRAFLCIVFGVRSDHSTRRPIAQLSSDDVFAFKAIHLFVFWVVAFLKQPHEIEPRDWSDCKFRTVACCVIRAQLCHRGLHKMLVSGIVFGFLRIKGRNAGFCDAPAASWQVEDVDGCVDGPRLGFWELHTAKLRAAPRPLHCHHTHTPPHTLNIECTSRIIFWLVKVFVLLSIFLLLGFYFYYVFVNRY